MNNERKANEMGSPSEPLMITVMVGPEVLPDEIKLMVGFHELLKRFDVNARQLRRLGDVVKSLCDERADDLE